MGLDMYLTAKRYLSQHDDYEKEIADKIGTKHLSGHANSENCSPMPASLSGEGTPPTVLNNF
jgi:hypothetical protein